MMAETEDYAQTPEAHHTSHEAGGSDELLAASYVNKWTRPGRLYAADGTTLKSMAHAYYTFQVSPENGDKFQLFFICSGLETTLNLGTYKGTTIGIFDIYINNILDSAGYDDYFLGSGFVYRSITLSQPIIAGINTIELRVNDKNVSSSNYYIDIAGASLQ